MAMFFKTLKCISWVEINNNNNINNNNLLRKRIKYWGHFQLHENLSSTEAILNYNWTNNMLVKKIKWLNNKK